MTVFSSVKRRVARAGRPWILSLAAMLFVAPLMSGCMDSRAQQGAGIGALGGGLAGSLIGPSKNKEQNALIGAAIGGLIGYTVGNEMDKNDKARLNNALETMPTRQTTTWVNPDTRAEYAVTPQAPYQVDGRDCRQAEISSVINGKRETVVKTACRRPDGRWEI
ncbi:hypothetical protein SIID45300_03176 [Candidatus Magnetaquicoccaceae bacterium FCR-1]|uniref:YMGG-like Gly-zipper domain-containing protein n=1 Tax=Candidatus Magnetaquiglobus chichijimensis TaxID=3141448 RepID=A0ABQ0CD67_9PROT